MTRAGLCICDLCGRGMWTPRTFEGNYHPEGWLLLMPRCSNDAAEDEKLALELRFKCDLCQEDPVFDYDVPLFIY